MRNKVTVAFDVGSTKVACVAAAMGGPSGFEIEGVGASRYPIAVKSWPAEPDVIAEAIERALGQAGVAEPVERALVAVTHPELTHHRATAQIELAQEPVAVRDPAVRRLRAQAVAQALAVDREVLRIETLGYDGNGFNAVRDPRGLLATRLRGTFQVVAIPINMQRAVTQAMELAGLEVERMLYSLPAAAAGCVPALVDAQPVGIEPGTRAKRVLFIDLGGRVTDVAVLDRMALERSATIPWGASMLVDALAASARLTLDQALAAMLAGLSSQKPEVVATLEAQLPQLDACIQSLLADSPLPDRAIVTGGGALIDGLVEWIQARTGIPAVLGRSPRAVRFGELAQQVSLTTAIGLLELTARAPSRPNAPSSRLLGRLLQGTKSVLSDYF
jgi:cell division protein FtsA